MSRYFVSATGRGSSDDEAYAVASRELAAEVLGDPQWLRFVPVQIHDPGRDPLRRIRDGGTVQLEIGLSRVRTVEVISAMDLTKPQISVPDTWRDVVYPFVYAHLAAHICRRREVLFGTPCPPQQLERQSSALRKLAEEIRFVSSFPDGVPVGPSGEVLSEPTVSVRSAGVPVASVPVLVTGVGGAQAMVRVRSDGRGEIRIEWPPPASWTGPVRIELDSEQLLGPLHTQWEPGSLELVSRETELRRWAGVVVDGRSGALARADSVFVTRFAEVMSARGAGAGATLSAEAASRIAKQRGASVGRAVTALARRLGGEIDVVVLAAIRSGYASRAGRNRIWYAAQGTLTAYDVWTGRVRAEVQTEVTASGIGDERAERAARRELAEALVDKWLEREPGRSPSSSSAEDLAPSGGTRRG